MNWEEMISKKMGSIPPSGIRKFFDLAANMDDLISLGVGEPDFTTPWHIREAALYSLEQGKTMYTSNYGLLELREEISNDLKLHYNLNYNAEDQILVTVGVSEALDLALRALIDVGDEVLLPEPAYVSYQPSVLLAGGNVVKIRTSQEEEFKLKADILEESITSNSKVLILCYPNNPTGAIMEKEDLEEIAQVVEEYNLIVLADEIYSQLTYHGEHVSFASLPGMKERTILFNGFSKAYAMTGWRLGYAAASQSIIKAMMKIHQYTMLCAPIISQNAALEALRNGKDDMKKMIKSYNQRRRVIVKGLNDIGLECFEPKGAFYAFPNIKNTGLSSKEFAQRLLKEAGVAVIPGDVFGETGEGHIRCSYATALDDIYEALNRMENFMKKV